jgi:methylated-DNA-protein-cysteine methyltransferase related protein
MKPGSVYQDIYELVRRIPRGRVVTYGQISAMVGRCTPRMVGYAMAALPDGTDVPWHRVVNRSGRISLPQTGHGYQRQKMLLEIEDVGFDEEERIDLEQFRWPGP